MKTLVWSGGSHPCAVEALEIAGLCSNQLPHQRISLIRSSSLPESVKSASAVFDWNKTQRTAKCQKMVEKHYKRVWNKESGVFRRWYRIKEVLESTERNIWRIESTVINYKTIDVD